MVDPLYLCSWLDIPPQHPSEPHHYRQLAPSLRYEGAFVCPLGMTSRDACIERVLQRSIQCNP